MIFKRCLCIRKVIFFLYIISLFLAIYAHDDSQIYTRLGNVLTYHVKDMVTFSGDKHPFYLGMKRTDVLKIMDERHWTKIVDEYWADKNEAAIIQLMKNSNVPQNIINSNVAKFHDASALMYKTILEINPVTKFPMRYYFKFKNDVLIEYTFTVFTIYPKNDHGGWDTILTKMYQETCHQLGAPDPNANLQIGTTGIWFMKNNNEQIQLIGEYKWSDKINKNFPYKPHMCDISIKRSFTN